MSPEETYSYPPSSPDGSQPKKRLRLLVLLAIVVVIVLGALAIMVSLKSTPKTTETTEFSITATTPGVKQVTTQTPSIAINFNRPLETNSASVASSPSIITSTSTTDNTLTLTFAAKTLVSAKKYTITINSISSTTGERLTDQLLTFTPTFVGPTTSGGDALINIGLSTDQVNSLFTYISQFDPSAQNVVIDESSIKHYMESPNDAWSPWAVSFSMNVDSTNYKVVSDFDDTEHIQVTIYNATSNQQLFTAGSPGSY